MQPVYVLKSEIFLTGIFETVQLFFEVH